MKRNMVVLDGNQACAHVAYRSSEVIAIYPITPASPMGEWADMWSASKVPNLWGTVPLVGELQSEGGAAGAIHGALQAGSLSTTFTASQGLLLMLPNMFKIAGELSPAVIHVAARSVAAHALSIFGDHSDVMAARMTGFAMLFSSSVQEAMDLAIIAHAATLESRIPFLHIFDGFRTSHELNTIEVISDDDMRAMLPDELIRQHRMRALNPDRPFVRGTAQNPDVYFQGREAANPYYARTPNIVQKAMDNLAARTGRSYHTVEYYGHNEADRVIVVMGSASQTVAMAVDTLVASGEKVGMVNIHLYRPFPTVDFVKVFPSTTSAIAVLDRTKEPGSIGEPLYQDVTSAISEAIADDPRRFNRHPKIVGGRYGLSSKEFLPSMAVAIYGELKKDAPKRRFTVGIIDDVGYSHIQHDPTTVIEPETDVRAMFWGLGSDGTVSANKSSVQIIGEQTDHYAQAYFVYDSKKAGARTISHLRFGSHPIRAPYLIQRANFIAVHVFDFLFRYPILDWAEPGAVLLLNSPWGPNEAWSFLPGAVQRQILDKHLKVFCIDAHAVATESGMGGRINTVMQTCFFAISGVLPGDQAITEIKEHVRMSYAKRGEIVVRRNWEAIDNTLAHLHELRVGDRITSSEEVGTTLPPGAPTFVSQVTAELMAERGDLLPVSAMPPDGTFPSGTAQYEKRNLAAEIPVWQEDLCIQCGKCVLVCPHSVIRAKVVSPQHLAAAPASLKSMAASWKELKDLRYVLQVAPEDCTGCKLCVEVCPAKDKSAIGRKALNMAPQRPLRESEAVNWSFFLNLPDHPSRDGTNVSLSNATVKNVQLLQPMFEFSGACAGCGETPYVRLVSQLFGDRAIIANATGCSSIYGGNLPTTPWSTNKEGRGPAWANSLFEDNAEFGMGMRVALDHQMRYAKVLLNNLSHSLSDTLVASLLAPIKEDDAGLAHRRFELEQLRAELEHIHSEEAKDLLAICGVLLPRTVWIIGGDGWAYDIGFGGLDHVLASGANVNILVLDTEVYSNTGGQASKATPLGAVAKFAAGGKGTAKKDIAKMAMNYGNVYVAQIAMGANDAQTVKALVAAEQFPGPSLIVAYSHCIAHGIDMTKGMEQQKLAVHSGQWPLFRYDPRRRDEGLNPLTLDYTEPKIPVRDYLQNEGRFRVLEHIDLAAAKHSAAQAQRLATERYRWLAEQSARKE